MAKTKPLVMPQSGTQPAVYPETPFQKLTTPSSKQSTTTADGAKNKITSFNLPSDVVFEFKQRCVANKLPMSVVIKRFMEDYAAGAIYNDIL